MYTAAVIELLGAAEGPLPALSSLLQARRRAISLNLVEPEESELGRLGAAPVHPLLLCTSIAQAVLGVEGGAATVERYARGELVSGLEDGLLVLDGAVADDELGRVLDLESALLEDLMILSMETAGFRPNLSTEFLRGVIRDLVEETFDDELDLSIHEVRWATWLVTNPHLTVPPLTKEMQSAMLFHYGFQYNAQFHNATTREEENVNATRVAFNDALARGAASDEIHSLEGRHDLAMRRRERSRQFYWWNPCEADAHAVSVRARIEFERAAQESADEV